MEEGEGFIGAVVVFIIAVVLINQFCTDHPQLASAFGAIIDISILVAICVAAFFLLRGIANFLFLDRIRVDRRQREYEAMLRDAEERQAAERAKRIAEFRRNLSAQPIPEIPPPNPTPEEFLDLVFTNPPVPEIFRPSFRAYAEDMANTNRCLWPNIQWLRNYFPKS